MSEEQVCKEVIEQVGYQEFYRYFQEKTTLIEQQRKEIERLNNIIKKALQIAKELQYDIHDESCSHGTKNIDNLVKLLELKGSDSNGQ